jgi:hypothetical protein
MSRQFQQLRIASDAKASSSRIRSVYDALPSAEAALICKNGFLHYGGSGFHADRLQAEANAIEAQAQNARPQYSLQATKCSAFGQRGEKDGVASCGAVTVTLARPASSRLALSATTKDCLRRLFSDPTGQQCRLQIKSRRLATTKCSPLHSQ